MGQEPAKARLRTEFRAFKGKGGAILELKEVDSRSR